MSNKKGSLSKRQTLTQQAEMLAKKFRFTKEEVEKMLTKFNQVTQQKQKMDRNSFRICLHNIFQMTDDIIMDRVFKAFDKDNDSQVNQEEWIRGMYIFLRGTFDEKLAFCFDVYDMNSDGFISREEMFHLLKTSIVKQTSDEDPDEGIKELVEIALKKMDQDHDNRVSFKDYTDTCYQENLLLEFLGPCLPNEQCVAKVQCMLADEDSFEKIPVTVRINISEQTAEA